MLVGEQYMLTSILRETRDTILYRASQRDLRREVIVECLKHAAAEVPRKVQLFLDTAKVQAKFQGQHLSRVLEMLEIDGTWLVAKEQPAGEPLDMMLTDNRQLPMLEVCRLMILLCKLCLRLDAQGIACTKFHPEDVYYDGTDFTLSNPAHAGTRSLGSSRRYLASAARDLLPMIEETGAKVGAVNSLLTRMSRCRDNTTYQPALFLSELSRLHTAIISA